MNNDLQTIFNNLHFDSNGLIPIITQDSTSKEVLMLAWMNKEAIEQTIKTRQMVYYSRSRKKLWQKGETSGQYQELIELTVDCDSDCLLAKVNQHGVACHTGRKSCFFKTIKDGNLLINQEIIISPMNLYGNENKN